MTSICDTGLRFGTKGLDDLRHCHQPEEKRSEIDNRGGGEIRLTLMGNCMCPGWVRSKCFWQAIWKFPDLAVFTMSWTSEGFK
jgi:hypothetical protein